MRKIALLFLCFVFLASTAFGWNIGGTNPKPASYLMYSKANTSYTAYLTTEVSTSTIIPRKHVVLGWIIIPMGVKSESLCSISDRMSHAGGYAYDEIIDEAEADYNNYASRWLTYPRRIEGTLTIHQGPRTTVVVFYDTF